MGQGTKVATLFAELTLDAAKFNSGLQTATNGLQNIGGRVKNAGSQVTGFGAQLAIAAVPLGLIGKQSVDAAADFEMAMAEISARTGIVGQDLEDIGDFALQMGADTAFSAQEAAEGFLQLLSSGQDAAQALATLPIVLDLAAASGEDLGMTADVLTDIMAAFGLEVEDSIEVANALAQAAGASSADIASLGQGFANIGPVARLFGMDVTDTAAALAILSENGIKGAEAGTALKSMLMNMTRDTEEVTAAWTALGTSFYDIEGNARPLEEVLADIKVRLNDGTLSAEEQNKILADLAGSYGIVAMTALLGDVSIGEMIATMGEQATAAEVAQKRMDTFAGSTDALGGSIETLQIKAFTPFMEKTLRPLIDMTTQAINLFAEWAGDNPETTSTIIGLGLAIVALSAGALILGPILTFLGGGLTLVLSPITLLAGIFASGFVRNWDDFSASIENLSAAFQEGNITDILSAFGGAMYELVDSLVQAPVAIAEFILGADTVREGFEGWSTALESIKAIVIWIGDSVADILGGISFSIPGAIQELADLVGAIAAGAGDVAALLGLTTGGTFDPSTGLPLVGATYTGPGTPDTPIMGAKAAGGPVSRGSSYLVGERGPEIFTPGSSGVITPNSAMGGEPQLIIVQLDSSTLFEAQITEGNRRNVRILAT